MISRKPKLKLYIDEFEETLDFYDKDDFYIWILESIVDNYCLNLSNETSLSLDKKQKNQLEDIIQKIKNKKINFNKKEGEINGNKESRTK